MRCFEITAFTFRGRASGETLGSTWCSMVLMMKVTGDLLGFALHCVCGSVCVRACIHVVCIEF